MKRIILFSLLAFGILPMAHSAQPSHQTYRLIPAPQSVDYGGGVLTLNPGLISISDETCRREAELAQQLLRKQTGRNYDIRMGAAAALLEMRLEPGAAGGPEGYTLEITPENITLSAQSPHGLFYAVQTLGQMLTDAEQTPAGLQLPCVHITDSPRFAWRGMHLDICRHFLPKEFILRYIDFLAMHKLNTLHLHLTEDQGWRIEIKKYPKLTEAGSVRKVVGFEHNQKIGLNIDDGRPYGGYLSQDDIREILEYARRRYITIVPEIELPGHSSAALAAYPELGCTGGPYAVLTESAVCRDVFCAGQEKTFAFLQDVLDEVIDLFPSEYIHIGGDEVPKYAWERCPRCQARMKAEGLKDEHELQSYFIHRIETHINARGRKLIGWDEILEGGLSPNATVMSWRGFEGGLESARMGHDVVMTPSQFTYFNHRQDNAHIGPGHPWPMSVEKTYAFEPVPNELSPERQKYILGGQACLWTEYIPTPEHAEYLLFPRLCALAEVVWSPKDQRDFADFTRRMQGHYPRLMDMDVHYYVPTPTGFYTQTAPDGTVQTLETLNAVGQEQINIVTKTPFTLKLTHPDGTGKIRFWFGRRGRDTELINYTAPIEITDANSELTAIAVDAFGRESLPLRMRFRKTELMKTPAAPADTNPGLRCGMLEGAFDSAGALELSAVAKKFVVKNFARPVNPDPYQYGLIYQGFIDIPRPGIYTFATESRQGNILYIGSVPVVNNDGFGSAFRHSGRIALEKGLHPLTLRYFKTDLGFSLRVFVAGPEMEFQALPDGMLKH